MKHLTFAFLVFALGCKTSNDVNHVSSGSGATGSAVMGGSTTEHPGESSKGSAGSASGGPSGAAPGGAFDDTLTMPALPKREPDEQARVDAAATALRKALSSAKAAKDSAELCKAFEPLAQTMGKLEMISAPKGVDQQAFSSERDSLLQLFDGASNWCDNPANVGLDTLQDLMSKIRSRFVAFVGRGAA